MRQSNAIDNFLNRCLWCLCVTLHMRRTDPAARAAYVAEALRRHALVFGAEARPRPPCITCGPLGAGDWCNMCEVLGIHLDPALLNWVTLPLCVAVVSRTTLCRPGVRHRTIRGPTAPIILAG